MNAPETPAPRLTQLSHGGGCGCKIAPALLEQILADARGRLNPEALLVGIETADDAAVYRLSDTQAIVATTDFFMPIVDDPHDFGAIAATNAISDIYAMGATPLFALALVGMPVDKLPIATIRAILDGGAQVAAKAGIPIAGGHTIDSAEPIYGLVAIGIVDPRRLKRNAGARPGDRLILGKPLGVGVYSAAIKKGQLAAAAYDAMLACTTRLNTPGTALGALDAVHALTDVTGFGLLGHLLEMCRASKCRAMVAYAAVPLLAEAPALAAAGAITGASARNWASYGNAVSIAADAPAVARTLLTDPQTSGGLLVACAPDALAQVLGIFRAAGFDDAAEIGVIEAGTPHVFVR